MSRNRLKGTTFPEGFRAMEATALLKRDHDAVRKLFRAFVEAMDDGEARRGLFRAIRQALQTQSRIEEQVFYPAVMRVRAEPAREAVREALEEHHLVDGLIAELDQLDADDTGYVEKVRALQESVERHLEDEEQSMFAQARIHLTDERLERLGRDMALLRATLADGDELEERAAAAGVRA
jgi:hemerythrin superfamily protein